MHKSRLDSETSGRLQLQSILHLSLCTVVDNVVLPWSTQVADLGRPVSLLSHKCTTVDFFLQISHKSNFPHTSRQFTNQEQECEKYQR